MTSLIISFMLVPYLVLGAAVLFVTWSASHIFSGLPKAMVRGLGLGLVFAPTLHDARWSVALLDLILIFWGEDGAYAWPAVRNAAILGLGLGLMLWRRGRRGAGIAEPEVPPSA